MTRLGEMICELGDATRLRVLFAILDARKNVSQIVAELELAQPQVSYHLRRLKDAGLAVEEKDGRWVWYQVDWDSPDARVRELLDLLARWSGDTHGISPVIVREGTRAQRERTRPSGGRTAVSVERPDATPLVREREELEDFLL
ncbi:winged helix-turn-helix transcriptional regulator [bacterium]|nr:winged helix-turn-helix transcriptional regulator [bacterium]